MTEQRVQELDGFNVLVHGRDALYIANRNDAYVGRSLMLYGEYCQREFELIGKIAQPGACVVEVGAHIGAHTVRLAKNVGLGGRVVAIEPQPPLFQAMAGTMALNGLMNVDCYPYAMADTAGVLTIPAIDYRQQNNFGGFTLETPVESGIPVPQCRLDDIYRLPRLDLLKIDVEGMELRTLKGAAETVDRFRPMIYVENDRQDRSVPLLTWLFERRYRLWWHMPALFNADNYFGNPENVFGPIGSINILAVPEERETSIALQEVKHADEFPALATP